MALGRRGDLSFGAVAFALELVDLCGGAGGHYDYGDLRLGGSASRLSDIQIAGFGGGSSEAGRRSVSNEV
jgi:hypothetical protein